MKALMTIDLRVERNHYLRVFIWESKKQMRENEKLPRSSTRATEAYFRVPPVRLGKHCAIKNKIVGEIHLVRNRFGPRIFAHELQHFIQWWATTKEWRVTGQHWGSEKIADIAGHLTGAFWKRLNVRYIVDD